MTNHINTLNPPCSGCGACVAVCPKQAIKINLDKDGLYISDVDESLCVDCGLCKKVCMRNGVESALPLGSGTIIAAQSSTPQTIKKCTSGGIAYELSRYAFENNIGVLGVVYNYKTNRAESRVAETIDDIELFRGSKYIQSYTVDAFMTMLSEMKSNPEKKFIAFGTPCQIYGLASLLERHKMRDRAILVDLFCHGVPSYFVWDKYLEIQKKRLGSGQLTEVVFRDKSIGWHNFVIKLKAENGVYKEASEGDLFYHAFFDNVLFSKACFDCPVRKDVTKADIRLGDYWGKRFQDREDGISAVLLCTDRGKSMLQKINDRISLFESGTVEEVIASQSVHKYDTYGFRKNAFDYLAVTKDLNKTISYYRKKFTTKKRIKLFVKESTSKLPNGLRATIRKIYKKI